MGGMADLCRNPGELAIERNRFLSRVEGPKVVLFRAVQGNEGKRARIFFFIAGSLDAAQLLFRENSGTPVRGITPRNRKNSERLSERGNGKENERQRKGRPDRQAPGSENTVLLSYRKVPAFD